MTYDEANVLQRSLRRFGASGPGSWIFSRVLQRIDRPIYKLTGGKRTFANLVSGLPVVMLTTKGVRSGKPRTVPLLGLPTEDGLVVIASNFGQHNNPGWYYNLQADPTGEVEVDGVVSPFRAVEAHGEQRERIWARGLEVYPGWSTYERRAAHRHITVFVLKPV